MTFQTTSPISGGFTLGNRTIELAMGSAGDGMETITASERQQVLGRLQDLRDRLNSYR